MSTDFAIRPVSAPAPAVVVRDVAPSRQSPPTEVKTTQAPAFHADPAPARQEAEAAFTRETVFDKDSRELIFRVVDPRSDRVVRQLPEQAMLRLRAYTRALDEIAMQVPPSVKASA
jgi:hypothetical protein